jgi:hypothetical protein
LSGQRSAVSGQRSAVSGQRSAKIMTHEFTMKALVNKKRDINRVFIIVTF